MTHYVIGESPPEKIEEAIQMESTHGVNPIVSTNNDTHNNYRNNVMERYAELVVRECVKSRGLGIIEFTNPGCTSSMTYHEGNPEESIMLRIITTDRTKPFQRTTNEYYDTWIFWLNRYPGQLIVFRSIEDIKMWVIPYDLLVTKYAGNSVAMYDSPENQLFWDQFIVTNDNIADKIHEYYRDRQHLQVVRRTTAIIPIGTTQYKKFLYKSRLEQLIKPLKPHPIKLSHYNMILEDIRIQTKILSQYSNTLGYKAKMNTGQDLTPYYHTDFDALILFLPDINAEFFYFIPVLPLILHDIVASKRSKGKTSITVYTPDMLIGTKRFIDTWANKYTFRYDTPNLRSVLIQFFNNTYS